MEWSVIPVLKGAPAAKLCLFSQTVLRMHSKPDSQMVLLLLNSRTVSQMPDTWLLAIQSAWSYFHPEDKPYGGRCCPRGGSGSGSNLSKMSWLAVGRTDPYLIPPVPPTVLLPCHCPRWWTPEDKALHKTHPERQTMLQPHDCALCERSVKRGSLAGAGSSFLVCMK